MKNVCKIVVSLALAVLSLSAFAQIKVATGSAQNTYSTMFRELNERCGASLAMVEQNTNGSMTNIDLLLGNKINAAFVQSDVLNFRGLTENLDNVKTLIALHPEEVHVLAMNKVHEKGGILGVGATKYSYNSVADLEGKKVGAVGGSFVTAQVVRLQSGVNYNALQFDDTKTLLAALTAGEIDAAIFVGGQPIAALEGLGPQYKMLSFTPDQVSKLSKVYRQARLSYNKMGAAGISTIATDALFVTREYKTPAMLSNLAKIRQCAFKNLDELKETTGTHPKWQAVDATNKGKWNWYELPAVK